MGMACIHCGASNMIDAHLIPKAFVMQMSDRTNSISCFTGRDRAKGQQHWVCDSEILCVDCDNLLRR